MDHFDVVVVGAGPGGSSSAYFLAKAGVSVALLDKEVFPRAKACSDCVSLRGLKQLGRMGLEEWVDRGGFHAPTKLRLGAPNGELATLELRSDAHEQSRFGRMIPRKKLDAVLVERAAAAGARLITGARATGISMDASAAYVHIVTNGKRETLRCQIAIAADGTSGSFSRSAGLPHGASLGIAARTYMAGDDRHERFFDWLYESDLLPGYGWIFPMGGGVCNVGIGVPIARGGACDPKERLHDFISTNPHTRDRLRGCEVVEEPRVACLDWGFRPKRAYGCRLLAVGDAAGLVNPLTGSGIRRALVSGELAAECACDALASGDFSASSLGIYGQHLWARFGRQHTQLRMLQWLFGRRQVVSRIVQSINHDEAASRLATDILAGKAEYVSLLKPVVLAGLLLPRS